jgi:hypothetical protein
MAVNMGLIMVSWALFPMPEGMDMNVPEQMNAYVATLPIAAFLIIIAAHLGQAFVGGWVAARLGASHPVVLALIIGVLALMGGVANMMMIEHPAWMYIEVPLYLVVAYVAGMLEVRRRAALPA